MRKLEKESKPTTSGRVLARVLAEDLRTVHGQVGGGPGPIRPATPTYTNYDPEVPDFTNIGADED